MKHRMTKIIASTLLLAVLIVGLAFPAGAIGYDANAETLVPSDADIIDIRDFNGTDIAGSNGWYGISNAEGLTCFSDLVNSNTFFQSPNVRVCLCASIDMKGVSFTPIGKGMGAFTSNFSDTSFRGTFDGRGYVIDNLTTAYCVNSKKGISYASLFGIIRYPATIRNLVIGSGCEFSCQDDYSGSCVAALAARIGRGVQIQNVINFANVEGGVYCGGLVARIESEGEDTTSISDCTNVGSVNGRIAGGLVGYVHARLKIKDCVVQGAVIGTDLSGGAIGTIDSSVTVELDSVVVQNTVLGETTEIDTLIGSNPDTTPEETDCEIVGHMSSSSGVRFHGVQLAEKDDTVSIRFIASLDSETVYSKAGFLITANGSDPNDFSCTKLFTSLLGQVDGETVVYTAEALRGESGFLFAATIEEIPLTEGNSITFTVAPYATGDQADSAALILKRTEGGYAIEWN